jgi:subfamily B ATP-binding cassette protein MsbA
METSAKALIKRLWREYISHHLMKLGFAVACMMVAAATTAANAYLMQPVLDDIFLGKDQAMLMIIPLLVVFIAVTNGFANYGQTVFMRFVGQRIIADMQINLFAHLMRADIGLFHDQASGRLISRFTNDINMMRASVSHVLTGVAKESLTMIFLIGVMLYQSWELTLIAFTVFPMAIYPVLKLGRRMRKVSNKTQQELGHFTAQLDETFQGVRVVKGYAREEAEIERAKSTIDRLFGLYFKSAKIQAGAAPLMETFGGLAIAGVIWYGGSEVITGDTSPGAFFSFITATLMAYKPAKTLANLNTHLQEGLAAAMRFFSVMDTEPAIKDADNAKSLEVKEGAIRFEKVNFYYDEEGEAGVSEIDLEVPAGKTVALVGTSGGGKSTLMNLILRFYEVGKGKITIDGQDIRKVTLNSLRSSMAMVSQETILFDDTVRGNIAFGDPEAGDGRIIHASEMAHADEFIRELPHGYETMIGPHGVKLSGGQRQRLAIARAMLKDTPILLLDEATSALDTTSEQAVQAAFEELMEGRTTLVIAHRLSTIQHADIIYVMEKGRIVEQGDHKSLLKAKGKYYELYAGNRL